MTRDNYAITARDIAEQLASTPDDEPEPRQSTPPTQIDPDLLATQVADAHIEGDDQ